MGYCCKVVRASHSQLIEILGSDPLVAIFNLEQICSVHVALEFSCSNFTPYIVQLNRSTKY